MDEDKGSDRVRFPGDWFLLFYREILQLLYRKGISVPDDLTGLSKKGGRI